MRAHLLTLLTTCSAAAILGANGLEAPIVGNPLWGTSVAMAQSIEDGEAEADRLIQQAIELYQAGNTDDALALAERAVDIYHDIGDFSTEIEVLTTMGEVYYEAGEIDKALEQGHRVAALYRQLGDIDAEADVLFTLGQIYLEQDRYGEAAQVLQQGIELATSDAGLHVDLLTYGGLAQHFNGNYIVAIENFQRAIDDIAQVPSANPTKVKENQARLYFFLGGSYIGRIGTEQRYYPEVEPALEQAIALAQEVQDEDL
ncbi:MAG: tetratricopeptide repeat protein, partial [Leptolyngbya sp. SIO3F4]|nr:tetratricopeptide repeat protein [Leptolyngbya sp. SIO3F4]